jgi:hypothetical protein
VTTGTRVGKASRCSPSSSPPFVLCGGYDSAATSIVLRLAIRDATNISAVRLGEILKIAPIGPPPSGRKVRLTQPFRISARLRSAIEVRLIGCFVCSFTARSAASGRCHQQGVSRAWSSGTVLDDVGHGALSTPATPASSARRAFWHPVRPELR